MSLSVSVEVGSGWRRDNDEPSRCFHRGFLTNQFIIVGSPCSRPEDDNIPVILAGRKVFWIIFLVMH